MEAIMTKEWAPVAIVCSHGLDDVPSATVEVFKHRRNGWVPTIAPHALQVIRGDRHDRAFDENAGDIRNRYTRSCPLEPCRARIRRIWDELVPDLYMASHLGEEIDIKPGPRRRKQIEADRDRLAQRQLKNVQASEQSFRDTKTGRAPTRDSQA